MLIPAQTLQASYCVLGRPDQAKYRQNPYSRAALDEQLPLGTLSDSLRQVSKTHPSTLSKYTHYSVRIRPTPSYSSNIEHGATAAASQLMHPNTPDPDRKGTCTVFRPRSFLGRCCVVIYTHVVVAPRVESRKVFRDVEGSLQQEGNYNAQRPF